MVASKSTGMTIFIQKTELEVWARKVSKINKEAKVTRVYFNNHISGKAILDALQFKELTGRLTDKEKEAMAKAETYLTGKAGLEQWLG